MHGVFSAAWAVATLLHLVSFGHFARTPWDVALVAVGTITLLRPQSRWIVALAAIQVVQLWVELPFSSNHWLFTGFVNLTLLATWGAESLRVGRIPGLETVYPRFARLVRVELLILYLYAVVHKLNTGFFQPSTSCAVDLYETFRGVAFWLPGGAAVDLGAIWGTLVAEAGIGLALAIRRTRSWGVLAGVAFHVLLSVNPKSPYYNFSAMLVACYVTFLPPAVWAWLATHLAPVRHRWRTLTAGLRITAWVGRATVVMVVVGLGLEHGELLRAGGLWLWLPYAGVALAVALAVARRSWPAPGPARRMGGLVWLPLLVLLNGATPYLGLKTELSFAMYSNLRTEGERPNHVFLPTIHLASYQTDLVRILAASDPRWAPWVDPALRLPWYEVRRLAQLTPDASLILERRGVVERIPRLGDHPVLGRRLPYLESKLVRLRPVDPRPSNRCLH